MGKLKKKFRDVKKLPTWLFWLPAVLLRTLKAMMRTQVNDPCGHIKGERAVVTVTWHNRLLFFPLMFPRNVRRRTRAVVSPSRDGQYVTDLISFFKLKSLRGSTYKKGANALRGAVKAINAGNHVSFTPDGPRGPRYSMSRGPVQLASMTGAPIVPIAVNYSSYWEIKSWDRFQIPKPWAKITLTLGDAIPIPPNINDEQIDHWREVVRKQLMDLTVDTK